MTFGIQRFVERGFLWKQWRRLAVRLETEQTHSSLPCKWRHLCVYDDRINVFDFHSKLKLFRDIGRSRGHTVRITTDDCNGRPKVGRSPPLAPSAVTMQAFPSGK